MCDLRTATRLTDITAGRAESAIRAKSDQEWDDTV
jgi:hypothetical protein